MTGGQLSGGAYVLNVSQEPCRVTGVPRVDLLDANGRQIAPGGVGQVESPGGPVALASGEAAIVGVSWSNWCGPEAALPLQMRLTLDVGGTLTGPVRLEGQSQTGGVATEFPGCLDASHGSTASTYSSYAVPRSTSGDTSRPCAADQLAAFTGPVGPAAGTAWTTLFIINLPGFSCALPASPTLELHDAAGGLLATAASFAPADATMVLPAATAAVAHVGLANWCIAPPHEPLALVLHIGSASVPVTGTERLVAPGCNSPGQTPPPDFLYGSALALPNAPPPPEGNPADSLPLTVNFTVPETVAPGETLRYTVTLTDHEAYGKTDNLAAFCPNYTERLLLADGQTVEMSFALNCGPAGTLGEGDSVTFGMELVVPADAATGPATLVWRLGDIGPSAKGDITITAPDSP